MKVNPYDVDGMADAIHHALMLSREARRERMNAMREQVMKHDVGAWAESFLKALSAPA